MNYGEKRYRREYSLDALKIISTIIIIFHHYQQITGAVYPGINFYGGTFYFGWIVELFFVLSGYFTYKYISEIKNNGSFKNFFIKKASRLLPMVAVTGIVFEILVFLYQRTYQKPWFDFKPSIWGLLLNALGIQDGWASANPCVNNPTWYISVLLLCYVVFYVLTSISNRLKVSPFYFYTAAIFVGIGIQTYSISLPFLNFSSSRGYYAFFWGLLLAEILKKHKAKHGWALPTLSVVCIVGLSFIIVYKNNLVNADLNYILTFLYYPALIILFRSPFVSKIFYHKFIGKWGEISYNAYLWHVPFMLAIYIVTKQFHLDVNFRSFHFMLLFCLLVELFSVLSHYLLEKPINAFAKRCFDGSVK